MDHEVDQIVSDLLGSYQEVGGINRIDCSNLPSKRAIGAVCEDLLRLAFPGFLDTEAIASDELEEETTHQIQRYQFLHLLYRAMNSLHGRDLM